MPKKVYLPEHAKVKKLEQGKASNLNIRFKPKPHHFSVMGRWFFSDAPGLPGTPAYGSEGGDRTHGQGINSPLLYR